MSAMLNPAVKVALVSDWFAPRRGGIESHILGLGRALSQAGVTVAALTAQPQAEAQGFPVTALPVAHLPLVDLALPFGLLAAMERALSRLSPDVVHVHASLVAPACIAGVIAARRLGLPVVLTVHSDLAALQPALRAMGFWLRPRLAGVVLSAVSARIADQLAPLSRGHDVLCLPNGFDAGFWGESAHPQPPGDAFRMVSAMRLERKKRPHVLPRLQSQVASATGRPVTLAVAGEGPWRRVLGPGVEAPGWLTPGAMRALYAGAHAFVLPSRHESFGIAALEARAAGLPVIARAGTGVGAFITHGIDGFLCESDAAMAQALVRLARDGALWARMAGPRPELARFDWPQVASAHLAVYDRARGSSQ